MWLREPADVLELDLQDSVNHLMCWELSLNVLADQVTPLMAKASLYFWVTTSFALAL